MKQMDDSRRRQLARIHILAFNELKMSREEYEDMLFATTRQRSARALDEAGRLRTLDHLTALTSGQSSARQIRPRPSADRESMVRKIRALARAMNLPDRYLDGMSKKMFHVERYEWCNPDQLHRLVAALEYHRRRIQRKPA